MIVKCVECENEYEIDSEDEISNFQCECGGKLSSDDSPIVIRANETTDNESPKSLNERTTRWVALLVGVIAGLISFGILHIILGENSLYIFGLNVLSLISVFIAGLVTILVYPLNEERGLVTGALSGGITILIYIIIASFLGLNTLGVHSGGIFDYHSLISMVIIASYQIIVGLAAGGVGAFIGSLLKAT